MGTDNRNQKDIRKVWSHDISITIADGQTVGSAVTYLNGTITRLVMTLPDLDTDTTATLTIEDEDGKEIYNSAAQSDNGTTSLVVDGDVCGTQTFKITCATAQSGDKACTVVATLREQ